MKTVAILQARMGSTRLPGKVLQSIRGETMLARVVGLARRVAGVDSVVVATTTGAEDDRIVDECARLGVPSFRGSADDVLDRYFRAARAFEADVVMRVCCDSPLIDREVAAEVLRTFIDECADYASASASVEATFPNGVGVEVLSREALERAAAEASLAYQRSHVTAYLYEHPELFRLRAVRCDEPCPNERWSVDTPEDLAFVRAVYDRLADPESFTWRDVMRVLDREPELRSINGHVRQKALTEG